MQIKKEEEKRKWEEEVFGYGKWDPLQEPTKLKPFPLS